MAPRLRTLALAVCATLLTACSTDYVNVIPPDSTAIAAIDMTSLAKRNPQALAALQSLLHVDDVDDCGINFGEKLYAFETADGSLGLVASVADEQDLRKWLAKLAETGGCSSLVERKDCQFCTLKTNFVLGFTSGALLIMGPSVGAQQAATRLAMAKLLKADGNDIRQAKMFERLEQEKGAVALVAQAQALPDKIAAPLTLGAPKGTSPADICVAASIEMGDSGIVDITGENFSFNADIDKALKTAAQQYRPISGKYIQAIPNGALMAVACGVDGEDYINQLRSNEALRTLLIGLNTVIDIDMMLKSVKGDMLITVPSATDGKMEFQMVADCGDSKWLQDVDYWKKSCPEGARIANWNGDSSFHLANADWNAYFGLAPSGQLFFGSNQQLALTAGQPAKSQLPSDVQRSLHGKRLCLVVGVAALAAANADAKTATDMAKPMLGDIKTIVYSIR